MQTVKLKLVHAFGSTCSKNYRNCLAICDQDKNQPKIIFPAGKALARKYIDRSQMDFVQFSQKAQSIQCLTVLPTRNHVAVVEKPFDSALQIIKIYSMSATSKQQPHTIKIFNQSIDKVGIIRQIVFSLSQPKFMCALIGQPHNKLIFIDTSKNKPLAQSNFTVKQAEKLSICPQNSHLICVSGGSSLKLYKIEEYAFKPFQDIRKFPKGRTISEHTWYRNKIILAATDKCEILIIEEIKANVYEVRQEYHNVFNQPEPEKMTVTAICPFSKGFILGSNLGKFCLWTRKQDLNSLQGLQKLQLTRKWSTTPQRIGSVTCISINTKQDMLVISLSNNDIATLYLNEIVPQISQLIKQTTEKQINFQYLYKGFHSKPITGMSLCLQRPLFATCSTEDSTIRVWNYKSFGCKLLRMFYFKIKSEEMEQQKPIVTLSFHPSGYYLAVGCTDKLRVFHVMNTQLRPFKEIGIKKSHIVKFSNSGHLLAVAHQFNEQLEVDYIKVYNALTLQELVCFKQNQSIVKGIQWRSYDECLSCVYKNGQLNEWRTSDWSVSKKILRKQLQFQANVYNHASNSIMVYGHDKQTNVNSLQEFSSDSSAFTKQIQIDMKISKLIQIPLSKQKSYFLLALENGTLVAFGGMESPHVLCHMNHHLERITQILISPCGRYVVTCGVDALIFVYELQVFSQQDQLMPLYNSSTCTDDFLADVVLINKKQILKYNQKQKQFTKVITNLSKKLKMLSQQGQKKQKKSLTQLQLQKNRIVQDILYRTQKVRQQISQLNQKNQNHLSILDQKDISQAQVLQKNYEQKINFQAQKYFQLQQQLIQLRVLHQKKLQNMHKQQQEQIKQLKKQFENKFKQSQLVYTETKQQNHQATNIFELRLQQIQQQQELQVREIQGKRQKFKLETVVVLQELHQKLQKLKKQYSGLQKQRQEVKDENEELSFDKKKLEKQLQQIKEKFKDLLMDYDQKLQALKNKQAKIVEFEKKINELQKKKHILSYKATQMKKAIQPKDYQIQKLKSDLIKLKKQFQVSLQRKQKANLYLQKINKQKQYSQKCYQQQKKRTSDQTNQIDKMLLDVFICIQKNKKPQLPTTQSLHKNSDILALNQKLGIQQQPQTVTQAYYKLFFKELIRLYHKYVQNPQSASKPSINDDPGSVQSSDKNFDDVTKQIVYLQKSLFQINVSNQKNILRKNDQIYKRTKQNTQLINNLNQIKKQNRELALKIKSKNIQIQNLKLLKNQLLNTTPKTSTIAMKLMGTSDNLDESNKKTPINNSITGMKHSPSMSMTANSNFNLVLKQRSTRNLKSSGVISPGLVGSQANQVQNVKQPAFIKSSVANSLKPSQQPLNYQKRQCEIISEIEFINEKVYKFEFYIKDMQQRLRKHSNCAQCEDGRKILQDFLREV